MSRKQHKTSPIASSEFLRDVDSTFVVARRKGGRVRYQNTITAAMGKWVPAPANSMKARQAAPAKAKVAQRDFAQNAKPVPDYAALTVRELFTLARSHYGMLVTTKTRKPELVRLLAATHA